MIRTTRMSFFPDTSEEMKNMMWNQSRPDGGDNNSVNTVDMTGGLYE